MAATLPHTGRDLRFDSLRGLMLVVMTINHLPSLLSRFTDEPFGVFSAAEGFVFLSGLLAGLVYSRRLRREGADSLWQSSRGRGWMIWRWQVGAIVAALLGIQAVCLIMGFCSSKAPTLFYQHPWLAVVMGSTLLYQPGMLDILPMYCAFVTALPIVLIGMEKGYKAVLIATSVVLWALSQNLYGSGIDGAPLYPLHVGSFNLFAWQIVFFGGVLIGRERALKPEVPLVPVRPGLLLFVAAFAFYGWGVQHRGWVPPHWSNAFFGIMINKTALGLFRLADFGAVAYLIAVLGGQFPRLLTWRPLAFLGQNSIAVFAVQSVVAVVLVEFNWPFATPARNLITTALALSVLWITAAVYEAVKKRYAASGRGDDRADPIHARQSASLPVTAGNDVRAA